MSTQYDSIADQYAQTKSSPLRTWVEGPSFMGLVGDVRGMRVLDLACGDGHYTRALKSAGAREVLGVDISPAMIALAQQSPADPGIDYLCADVAELPDLGEFDCVAAAYLLHYARNVEELACMCERIAASLRPGARFVALNENPEVPAEPAGAYVTYGFSKEITGPVADGTSIRYRMLAGRQSFSFEARYFSAACYQEALTQAGLEAVEWHALHASDEGLRVMGDAYFAAYLSTPPVLGLSCRRPR